MECHFVLSARPISSLNPLLSLNAVAAAVNGIGTIARFFSLTVSRSTLRRHGFHPKRPCRWLALLPQYQPRLVVLLPLLSLSGGHEARFAFRMIVSAPQGERPLFPTFPLSSGTTSMRRGGMPTARSTLLSLRPDPISSTNRLLSIKSSNYLPRRLPATNLWLVMCDRWHNHDDVLHRCCKM